MIKFKEEMKLWDYKNWKASNRYDWITKLFDKQVPIFCHKSNINPNSTKIIFIYKGRLFLIENDEIELGKLDLLFYEEEFDKNIFHKKVSTWSSDEIYLIFLNSPLKSYQYKNIFYTWFLRVWLKIQIKINKWVKY